jgi:XTP/dITP diphosphohydrolase
LGVLATSAYTGGGMTRLVVATRNGHKVREIRAILGARFQLLALNDFPDAPKTVEDADTFAGNATKKAIELAQWLATQSSLERSSRLLTLADDSGLEVDALEGAPGVYSARFAACDGGAAGRSAGPGGNSADTENNAKLLRLLDAVAWEERMARFRCVLALTPVLTTQPVASPVCYADERELETELFEGVCDGRIGFAPRGEGGFGYDPLFIPDGHEQSFAELGDEVKNRISHRAQALARLRERLLAEQPAR